VAVADRSRPSQYRHRMPAVGLDGNHADIAMLAEERSSDERVA
jgi:hypothetical protein